MKMITPYDWNLPSGKVEGVMGKEAYLARLKEIEAGMEDPDEMLWTWGHHPLFHGDIWREDLDKISTTRPIIVWARSFHEVVINTPALDELGIKDPKHPQVDWMKGWFMEAGYKQHFLFNVAPYLLQPERLMPALKQAGVVAHLGGITTAADMAGGALNVDSEWASNQAAFENDQTPMRTFFVPVGSEIIASKRGGLEQAADFYVVLDTLEKLLEEAPRDDHRFTIHHAGYFTEEQAKRIGELGAVVSAQPYYLYTLGEKYADVGLGPERANYIGRYKSLLDNGVKLSFHSDFTMAPAEPLRLAWVAVNRVSDGGKVMGPDERITVEQALRAVTIDAAYAIRMEQEIGSIEPGKIADFTVLEQDPYAVSPMKLKDIPVWGTVFEGKVFPVEAN